MLLAESLLGSSSSEQAYIEDVFSTWLYTGNGSTQTITNGIDLAGKGGLVWMKGRSGATDHALYDTARGATFDIASNTTAAQTTQSTGLTGFLANGFSIGSLAKINTNAATYASWTFREQPKFFDIVTYTGNGAATQTITHNLGSVPGCIMVKATSSTSNWFVYHRSLGNDKDIFLNTNVAERTGVVTWDNYTPTATDFKIAWASGLNTNGVTYVAYLFAHNAGGFGATGADNVISCGSFTTNADGAATVNLGYEPQWVLMRRVDSAGNWTIFDNMRGWSGDQAQLSPNTSGAEGVGGPLEILRATGFATKAFSFSSGTYIYIAIRRGPMRTPTSGTQVFSPIASSAATGTTLTTGFPVDMQIFSLRTGTTNKGQTVDRLRGVSSTTTESGAQLITNSTAAETTGSIPTRAWDNTGFQMPSSYGGTSEIFWNFRRAPGFFDVVCYTGTGVVGTNYIHNLTVNPELIITKKRSGGTFGAGFSDWWVASRFTSTDNLVLYLNRTQGNFSFPYGGSETYASEPTSSTFQLGASGNGSLNESGCTYIAYLFASCPGVSKVGSYTGTGATQVIDCGFAAGARFVLIKRANGTGDWYVWDTARGIVAGNDPYLLLNSTAAEVTTTDWVDTAASGFELSNAGGNLVNTNGASYIFLAVS